MGCGFYEPLGPSFYFALVSRLPISGAVMLLAFARPITRLITAADDDEAIAASEAAVAATA